MGCPDKEPRQSDPRCLATLETSVTHMDGGTSVSVENPAGAKSPSPS